MVALLTARFVLELLLLLGMVLLGAVFVESPLGRWSIGAALAAVTAVIWGTALSPKRRVDLPLRVRVAMELTLFGVAGVGFAVAWGIWWALLLWAAELAVLSFLWVLGHPPGADFPGNGTAVSGRG